jgi:hypothetical protein
MDSRGCEWDARDKTLRTAVPVDAVMYYSVEIRARRLRMYIYKAGHDYCNVL